MSLPRGLTLEEHNHRLDFGLKGQTGSVNGEPGWKVIEKVRSGAGTGAAGLGLKEREGGVAGLG